MLSNNPHGSEYRSTFMKQYQNNTYFKLNDRSIVNGDL